MHGELTIKKGKEQMKHEQLDCEITKENLTILRDHLKDNVPSVKFDMYFLRADKDGLRVEFRGKNKCGTFGCALGWAPLAKGLEPEDNLWNHDEKGKKTDLDWTLYIEAYFNGLVAGYDGDKYDRMFQWCFNQDWAKTDNTIEGAIARIDYLIKFGLPSNAEDQRDGQDPLCYTVEKQEPINIEFIEEVPA